MLGRDPASTAPPSSPPSDLGKILYFELLVSDVFFAHNYLAEILKMRPTDDVINHACSYASFSKHKLCFFSR